MPVTIKTTAVSTIDNPVIGDIHLEKGSYVVIGDESSTFPDAVAQGIRQRLLFFQTEWFLDSQEGLPWIQSVFVKNPDLAAIRSLFRQVIAESPGVDDVISLELDFDPGSRDLQIDFKANLADGSVLDSADFAPFIVRV